MLASAAVHDGHSRKLSQVWKGLVTVLPSWQRKNKSKKWGRNGRHRAKGGTANTGGCAGSAMPPQRFAGLLRSVALCGACSRTVKRPPEFGAAVEFVEGRQGELPHLDCLISDMRCLGGNTARLAVKPRGGDARSRPPRHFHRSNAKIT